MSTVTSNSEIEYKCDKCKCTGTLLMKDVPFAVADRRTTENGLEIRHHAVMHIDCPNGQCRHQIAFHFDVWEHPVGQLGGKTQAVSGARVWGDFEVAFHNDDSLNAAPAGA